MSEARPAVPIVTIDGPSSSGKGTISRLVAARVGWHLLDSGALYRLVALAGIRKKLDPDDVENHVALARGMKVEFGSGPTGEERVLLDGDEVTHLIRTEEAGAGALPGGGLAGGPNRPGRTGNMPSPPPPDWWPMGGIWAQSSFRAPG
jgi:hypothetical protein